MSVPFTRAALALDPLELARVLLGGTLVASDSEGQVSARITEVEAYRGLDDPASHCYRGRTDRNAVMWGPAGHLYVYFVYGMHFCANVVGMSDGVPGAVLLRGAEITGGTELARARKPRTRGAGEYAIGPAVLTAVLGIGRGHNGVDLTDPRSPVRLLPGERVPAARMRTGPRVGVAAAQQHPWRFWIGDSAAVSTYRRGGRTRARTK